MARLLPFLLIVACALFLLAPSVHAAEPSPPAPSPSMTSQAKTGPTNPWSFDLSLYLWLPSINASLSAGPLRASLNETVIDIWNDTKGVPLIGMGRFEAHYDRFGVALDANYFYLDFKPQRIAGADTDITTTLGLLDYTALYRITGEPRGDLSAWAQKSTAPRVDLYAGGRTLWLKNDIDRPLLNPSSKDTLTSPIVGARALFDITPKWMFLIDGNAGGFNVQNVKFTGGAYGLLGYRTTIYNVPTTLMFGYKLLYYNVDSSKITTTATLHGPVIGLVASW